jgi:hypothetical protein
MIMDAQLLASDSQNFNGASGATPSTNAIDLGVGGRDVSRGRSIRAVARVTQAFSGGASIRADVVESDAADLSNATVIATGQAVSTAAAGVGASLADLVIPRTSKRYLGFSYLVSGTMTAGRVTAGLVLDSDSGVQFAANTGA